MRIKEVNQWRSSAGMGVFSSGMAEDTGVPCGPTCAFLGKSFENGVWYSERQKAENGRTPSFAISCFTADTRELVHFCFRTGTRIHSN